MLCVLLFHLCKDGFNPLDGVRGTDLRARAVTAVPVTMVPVLLTSELPGRASMRALAFALGSCCPLLLLLANLTMEDEAVIGRSWLAARRVEDAAVRLRLRSAIVDDIVALLLSDPKRSNQSGALATFSQQSFSLPLSYSRSRTGARAGRGLSYEEPGTRARHLPSILDVRN